MTDIAITQMLESMLEGVVVFVRTADSRDFKERIVRLDPSLLRLTWSSVNPNKNKVREIALEDMNVGERRCGES